MIILPSILSSVVDKAGRIVEPWTSFLAQFAKAPSPILDITVGASPFEYTVKEPGNMYIQGVGITAISLTRGTDTIQLGVFNILVPVCIGDIITVTFGAPPTALKFLPNYASRKNQ